MLAKPRGIVTAQIDGRVLERYSPLLYRLAKVRNTVSHREHANSRAEL